jgi:Fis family transcriptional regulator
MSTGPIAAATQTYLAAIEDANLTLREFEKETRYLFVGARLGRCGGNQCHAARELGIHRNTLARILVQMERDGRDRSPSLRGRPGQRRRPATVLYDPDILARITGTR